jgi:hypothetical protein
MDTTIQLHYIEYLSDYLGNLIVDLELDQKSEEEIVNALNEFEAKVKSDIVDKFEDIDEDELFFEECLENVEICDNSLTIEDETISLDKFTTNSALLYITALKKEKIEVLRCFKNLNYLKEYWTLPISQTEYCKNLNLEKSLNFVKKYN